MNDETRFLADASLAGLSKWLRLLGYDTMVYVGESGRPMMRRAKDEQRILLTRRRDMMERQFSGRVLLMPEMKTAEQLRFVISKLSLKIHSEKIHTLCLSCNERLTPVGKDEVRDLVPEFVFEHTTSYNRCPRCRKIYWSGTHVQNALQFLAENHIPVSD